MFVGRFFAFINNVLTLDEDGFINARRLFRFFLFVLIFFALIFGTTFVVLLRNFKELQLPNVEGKNITIAIKTLQEKKLKTYLVTKSSIKHEKFEVIKQSPKAGTLVKQNRTVTLTVSLGPRISKMPNFVEQNIYDVKAKLLEIFSTYQTVPNIIEQRRYSTHLKKDRIIKQVPTVDTPINLDEDILFVVSRGIASNQIKILNYLWRNYKEVQVELENFGIDVRVRGVLTVDSNKIGQVFSQNIKPGRRLKSGDSIEFKVGIKEGLDNKIFQSEVYRVYSIKVPYGRNVKISEREETVISNELPDESPLENKTNNKKIRWLKILVKDELGTSTRFEKKVFAGSYLDIPYKSYGKGILRVYLDGNYYSSLKFE